MIKSRKSKTYIRNSNANNNNNYSNVGSTIISTQNDEYIKKILKYVIYILIILNLTTFYLLNKSIKNSYVECSMDVKHMSSFHKIFHDSKKSFLKHGHSNEHLPYVKETFINVNKISVKADEFQAYLERNGIELAYKSLNDIVKNDPKAVKYLIQNEDDPRVVALKKRIEWIK